MYSLSERELCKVALGLNLQIVAFKGVNTWYEKGAEHVPADETSELFRKMKSEIEKRDKRCRQGFSLTHHDLLAAVIFKEPPAGELTDRMAQTGYRIVDLPRNPKPLAAKE